MRRTLRQSQLCQISRGMSTAFCIFSVEKSKTCQKSARLAGKREKYGNECRKKRIAAKTYFCDKIKTCSPNEWSNVLRCGKHVNDFCPKFQAQRAPSENSPNQSFSDGASTCVGSTQSFGLTARECCNAKTEAQQNKRVLGADIVAAINIGRCKLSFKRLCDSERNSHRNQRISHIN